MIELKVRLLSEGLAREVDRRTFLRRASQTTVAGLMALAAGHWQRAPAAASSKRDIPDYRCSTGPGTPCFPPGPFCSLNGGNITDGCNGGHCYRHRHNGQVLMCQIWYCCYATGCWTSPYSGGYCTCCDCECGGGAAHCGCAQYSGPGSPPPPQPDAPKA